MSELTGIEAHTKMKEMERELNLLLSKAMDFAEKYEQGFQLDYSHYYYNGAAAKEYGWDSSSASC